MRVFFLSPAYNASASSCPPLPPTAAAHAPETVAYGLSPPLLPILPNSSILCPRHRLRPPVVFHRPTTALPRLTAHRSATAAGSAASPVRPSTAEGYWRFPQSQNLTLCCLALRLPPPMAGGEDVTTPLCPPPTCPRAPAAVP